MESADPHAAGVDRHHRRQACQHFARRLVGKSHGQETRRADLAGLDQVGDARGQNPRLAAAGARQHQGTLARQGYRLELFGIEIVEETG